MIEDIFLAYANLSLREEVKNLHKIFSVIKENINIDLEGVDRAIDILCELSKHDSPEAVFSLYEEITNETITPHIGETYAILSGLAGERWTFYYNKRRDEHNKRKDERELEDWIRKYERELEESIAKLQSHELELKDRMVKELIIPRIEAQLMTSKKRLEAIRSEESKASWIDCRLRDKIQGLLGQLLCEKDFVQKCYVCYQACFTDLLNDIVKGKEYSQLENIDGILRRSSIISNKRTTFTITDEPRENTSFREKLGVKTYLMALR